ncbi:MAG: putative DNA modification/repair radical SAM protein [bacterium]|nr:putative DNA modification/repair radical SAM protein [bacterium]
MLAGVEQKLDILAAAAKYDAACASSGSTRRAGRHGLGAAAPRGICHSWSDDGRCISLLKILFTNRCIYDCAYCANRRSNNIPRASFTVSEVVDLTMAFYLRNYIEGLFLSSGVERSPDYTMEQLIAVCRRLREERQFHGYIHVKAIPGASPELIRQAGLYADRVSVNIELPTEESLRLLAPQKSRENVLTPMRLIAESIAANRDERRRFKSVPRYAPAGQSTQLIVSASPESDHQILRLAASLYSHCRLKRVYYSAYVPVNDDTRLPAPPGPDLLREHRLYQADWLVRVYGFACHELVDERTPYLERTLDPKCAWALRHPELFPIEITRADYETLLRVPGIGIRSAKRILAARRVAPLRLEDLANLGVVMKRAQYFVTCQGKYALPASLRPDAIRAALEASDPARVTQLDLFGEL